MPFTFHTDEQHAKDLDVQDKLAAFRSRFYIPKDVIYMDGNSLGLLSKDAEASILRLIDEWKRLGINGWLDGFPPWFYFAEKLGNMQAPLVGANSDEVIVTNSTTVNLHNLVATFFKPTAKRNKILADELNFPSDIYALESQLRLHRLNREAHLLLVKSKDGRTLSEDDIIVKMKDDVAVAVLPSVLYRSGQLLDMEKLTKAAHERGIIIGFDCSHSVGAVPHRFSEWEIDFAFWCNYKYLNNGPGGTASLFINKKHFDKTPGLSGWFGYRKDKQFDMALEYEANHSAGGWQIGTTNLLSTVPLEGSLEIFNEVGIDTIREVSLMKTSYLMFLISEILAEEPYHFRIGTPREMNSRGGHVAIEHEEAMRINQALKKRGVIPDFRYPNVIRLAPIALYNTYHEIWQVVQHLKSIIDEKDYERYSKQRGAIT